MVVLPIRDGTENESEGEVEQANEDSEANKELQAGTFRARNEGMKGDAEDGFEAEELRVNEAEHDSGERTKQHNTGELPPKLALQFRANGEGEQEREDTVTDIAENNAEKEGERERHERRRIHFSPARQTEEAHKELKRLHTRRVFEAHGRRFTRRNGFHEHVPARSTFRIGSQRRNFRGWHPSFHHNEALAGAEGGREFSKPRFSFKGGAQGGNAGTVCGRERVPFSSGLFGKGAGFLRLGFRFLVRRRERAFLDEGDFEFGEGVVFGEGVDFFPVFRVPNDEGAARLARTQHQNVGEVFRGFEECGFIAHSDEEASVYARVLEVGRRDRDVAEWFKFSHSRLRGRFRVRGLGGLVVRFIEFRDLDAATFLKEFGKGA